MYKTSDTNLNVHHTQCIRERDRERKKERKRKISVYLLHQSI